MAEARIRLALDGAVSVVGGLNDVGMKIKDVDRAAASASGTVRGFAESMSSGVGISAGQTANALRGLPAQITDVVVSLQSGQKPLTVLLQQGGQLKDMFGGIGPAARAVAGYAIGLINPLTLAAAAAAGLAYAYNAGSQEAIAYSRALILTGNAAGTTANRLQDMAANIARTSGTQGAAAEALAALAGSGRVASANLEQFARVAVLMEKTVGQSVADTVKDLSDLGKTPVEASERLNEKYRYLTASVYLQIKALQDQGRTEEAAEIAQKAYASAFESRSKALQANLGLIERGWNGVVYAAKLGWDSILGIGRGKTLRDELAGINEDITAYNPFRVFGPNLDQLKSQKAALEEVIKLEGKSAVATATSSSQEQARIAFIKEGDKFMSKAATTEREIVQAREQGKLAGLGVAEIEKRVADIRAKNAEKGPDLLKQEATAYTQLTTTINEKIGAAQLEINGFNKLNESQKLTIKLDEGIASGKIKLSAAHVTTVRDQLQMLAGIEATVAANKQIITDMETRITLRRVEQAGIDAYGKSQTEAYESAVKGSRDALKMAQQEFDQYGLTKSKIAELTLAKYEAAKASALEGSEPYNTAQQQIDAQKQLVSLLQKGEVRDQYKTIFDSIDSTAHSTFVSIFDSGKNAFDRLRDTLKSGLLDLLYQMTLKKWILSIGTTVTGAALSGAASAATDGGTSGLSGLLNGASTIKSAYSAISGGFAAAGSLGTGFVGSVVGGLSGAGVGSGLASATGLAIGEGIASVTGPAIASALGTGITAIAAAAPYVAVALAAAYVLKKGFGHGEREIQSQGIEGTFGGTGFTGNTYNTWKEAGGWFSSDRTGRNTSGLDATTAKQFDTSYAAIKDAATTAATALGLSADSIASYSEKINLVLTDDAAKNTEAVTKVFVALGNNLVTKLLPSIGDFSKEGETVSATLTRLSTSLGSTNTMLSAMRLRLFSVSVAGADAASKLVDVFGGLETLVSASKAYYDAYYTEAERTTASTVSMTNALAAINVSLPTSKTAFRDLIASLDLSSESGRAAYATLIKLAPEFDTVSAATAKLAADTASKLMATFTANGLLNPALDMTSIRALALTNSVATVGDAAGSVTRLFLDTKSGIVSFGSALSVTAPTLDNAQRATSKLRDQIDSLSIGADRSRIDIIGLGDALDGFNTETFVNTIGLVLESLATRIKSVVDSISTERAAVRDVAIQIINPTVMSKVGIQRGIGSINTGLPGNSDISLAAARLSAADTALRQTAAVAANFGMLQSAASAKANAATAASQAASVEYNRVSTASMGTLNGGVPTVNSDLYGSNAAYKNAWDTQLAEFQAKWGKGYTRFSGEALQELSSRMLPEVNRLWQQAVSTQEASNAANSQLQTVTGQSSQAYAQVSGAQQVVNAASAAAMQAQIKYANALQDFAIDASKSVGKLSSLRQETVKYYEAQKQLSDLMSKSASSLRDTIASYNYSQLTSQQQFDDLQTKYTSAYALAMSTDGETLAGYGDKLNSLLNPLLEKAREVYGSDLQYNAFVGATLARADAIAGRLESLTPTNYAADSLSMLSQIDSTLAALDASSKSAEKIISDAVNAGSDKTANGLHAVIAALTGQAIPGFAAGGDFSGGLRIVGENGPELEATGPSRIFNAGQTRSIFAAGSNADVITELRGLRQDNANMRAELRAIATSNAKLARQGDRAEQDGVLIRTDADTPISTKVAV